MPRRLPRRGQLRRIHLGTSDNFSDARLQLLEAERNLILLCHEDASRTSFAFERDGRETELAAVGAGLGGHVQRISGMSTDMPLTPDKALLSYSLKKRRALDRQPVKKNGADNFRNDSNGHRVRPAGTMGRS